MQTKGIAALLLLAATVDARGPAASEENLRAGLARVEVLIEKQKWQKAHGDILVLLEEHRGQSYVNQHRSAIENDLRRCLFWMQHGQPKPKDLVSGRLSSYSKSTGLFKVTYGRDQLGDFVPSDGEDGQVLFHPAAFEGNHTIEIKGDSYDPDLLVLVCADLPLSFYVISFGRPDWRSGRNFYHHPAAVGVVRDSRTQALHEFQILDDADSPAQPGRKFRIKVTVSRSEIKASFNGKQVLKAKKRMDHWGNIGLAHSDGFKKIEFDELWIKGCSPSWIEGLVDERVQAQWGAFEESFRSEDHLPDWLSDSPSETNLSQGDLGHMTPGPYFDNYDRLLQEALQYHGDGSHQEGLEFVEKLDVNTTSPEFRLYLKALFHFELGKYDEADLECKRLAELDPQFHAGLALLQARLLVVRGKLDESIAEYRKILTVVPELADARGELAYVVFLSGRLEETREILRQAQSEGLRSEQLDLVKSSLTKLEKGPDWDRTYEYVSDHYHVYSDINRSTCFEASKILESAHNLYRRSLIKAPDRVKKRFTVYLFSGEEGYQVYIEDLVQGRIESTGGLYFNTLEQLLIWNRPRREDMMRTVRHEGLHQYLDRMIEDVPRWLGEGLGEYYENASRNGTSWILDQAHPLQLMALKANKNELVPLREFVYQDPATFMSNPVLHYAQAWGLVHYLRHSTPANQELFENLLEALQETADAQQALKLVFAGVDFARMERDLHQHLFTGLRGVEGR